MSSSSTTTSSSSETIIKDVPESDVSKVLSFFNNVGVSETIPSAYSKKGFYSDLVHGLILRVDRVERGKVSCLISVKPVVTNFFGALHGGAVAAVAEILSIACARTVVGEDRELFLGEMSMSYLSAAPSNVELIVDASVVRSGRNITVVAVEFRSKKTGKLVDTARATFYNTPTANLTENALKNHWNCSLKKKLDLYIALGLDTNNDKTKVEGRKFDTAKQSLSITFSLDQKKESKCLQGTLSLDLTLGAANGRDSHLQSSSKERVEINDPMKPPSGFRPNNSCTTLDGNLVKFSLPQRLTEDPINLINLSTPRSPSDRLPPLLDMPFNVTASTREQTYFGTAKSPLKPQSNACSMNCLCADEKCKDAGTPQTVEYINHGFLCYQPLQIEDLRNYQAEGEFPSTDSYIRTTGIPISYYTPPSHDGGNLSRCSSPESVLRSAARSFKNTPSIIRKRGSRTGNLIQTDGISTLEDSTDKSSNRPQSKQILLSPPKYRKLGMCTSNKSVEKRLELAFDTVWDSNNSELPRVH